MHDLYQRSAAVGQWGSSSPPRLPNPTANNLFHATSGFQFAPTKILNDTIRARNWDACRVRVCSHPWDASYRAKQRNNATPLHLACLYRAPLDVVQMILEANPRALFSQDSEGWTPLHVILLYGDDEETALMLIRRGGAQAASIQSRIVGAPLHLACRHGCSTTIIQELLRVNPAMATTANEYSTKPARILWYQYSRNPENERLLNDLAEHQNMDTLPDNGEERIRDLVDRLALLVRAAKGKHHYYSSTATTSHAEKCHILHDVIMATEETLGDLSPFLPLLVLLYPEQVRTTDACGDLPLHKAASYRPPRSLEQARNLRRTMSLANLASAARHHGGAAFSSLDPVDVLVQSYPTAASIPNRLGHLPLHIALSRGQRTWRTGIESILSAAPQVLLTLDSETRLLPFQLAAAAAMRNSLFQEEDDDDEMEDAEEVLETVVELLLACPHAMPCSQ